MINDNTLTNDASTIMLIEEALSENLRILSRILKEQGFNLRSSTPETVQLDAVSPYPTDLIMIDIQGRDNRNIDICRQLKFNENTSNIPLIFIHPTGDMETRIAGFRAGCIDFITRPFRPDEIMAKIKVQLELHRLTHDLKYAYRQMDLKADQKIMDIMAINEILLENDEKLRTLNDNLPLGVFRTSLSGKLLSENKAMHTIFDYSSQDDRLIYTDVLKSYANPEDRLVFLESLEKYRKLTGYEILMKRRNGSTFHAAISVRLVYDQKTGEEHIEGVLEDISEKKEIEARNKLLEKQILQAQKMEAIGTLAGGIAHDFNNILSAVLGFSELARLRIARGQDIKDSLDQIYSAGVRARDLVHQILMFSRHTDIKRSPIVIPPLVKETLKFLTSSLPATIEIRQHIDNINKHVYADPTQIQQILMNLCTNSAHAMKGKGILSIYLTQVVIDHSTNPEYKNLPSGNYLRITVSDTGHGIEPAIIHRIFEPFFTTKKLGEGTGMGLSVVHGIIKNMGGDIFVYSKVNAGTTFHVLLPVHEGRPKLVQEKRQAVEKGQGRILLVDDEDLIIKSTRAILNSLGYVVENRTSSREALECFKTDPGKFDLILTDLTMPSMTGVDLAVEIRKISKKVPIVLCTGFSTGITEQARKESGINAILVKPILINELSKTLKDALNAGDGNGSV